MKQYKAGVLALPGYGLYDSLIYSSKSLWAVRLRLVGMGLGILLLDALRQRLIARKSDR